MESCTAVRLFFCAVPNDFYIFDSIFGGEGFVSR